jgi:hypothetical protein
MGGDVTRTLPQIPGYADPSTFGLGYVHKLITIDTPHWGSPLASALHDPTQNNSCVRTALSIVRLYAFLSVSTPSSARISGATGDLEEQTANVLTSNALIALHQRNALIPTAMIGGMMTTAQNAGAGKSLLGATLVAACGNKLTANPLAQKLNATAWPTLMGGDSDGVVPLDSQFDKEQATYSNSTNTKYGVHSAGAVQLGFLKPTVLDQASGVPEEVVSLLNTAVTNTAIFEVKP